MITPYTLLSSSVISTADLALKSYNEGDFLWTGIYLIGGIVALAVFICLVALVLIYLERKIAGHFQCRMGPMRVGFHGILQPIADGLKLIQKEDLVPSRADKLLHIVAPFFSLLATILALTIIPFAASLQLIDLNIGVLYLTAVSGFGVLGILIGGWSSNNKWSLLGAMRAGAQIISYEISATLALLVIVLFSGSLKLSQIILVQENGWWIWRAHGVGFVAFIIFLIAGTAEINRTPFDIPEGESELTAGFHTEYSSLRFGFFFLAEFINMFTMCAMTAILFLGGWMPFHIGNLQAFNSIMDLIPGWGWFFLKSFGLIFLMMWFRWTFPRLRVDQLMRLEWKVLLPIGFINLIVATLVAYFNLYFYP